MKKDTKDIHIGNILRAAVDASGMSIKAVTKRAKYVRGSYYKHIEKPDLSLPILLAYGKAIGHDFSEEVPQLKLILSDDPAVYQISAKQPETLEEALTELSILYKKWALLQEKYLALVEERESKKLSR